MADKRTSRQRPPQKSSTPPSSERARDSTEVAGELLKGEAEPLMRKTIERGLEGDSTALRLCVERLFPVGKNRTASFKMPRVESAADAATLMAALLSAVAEGSVTPSEAGEIARLVDVFVKTLMASDLEGRLVVVEAQAKSLVSAKTSRAR